MDIKILTTDMDEYPQHLRAIPDAPKRLFYIGDISLIKNPLIAMVGTRRASPYGRWAAKEIAGRIAACGIPIVSGMAEGIDAECHKACLRKGTPTVAVLGTGIDVPFPKSNKDLYTEITQKGLILSEYEPGDHGMAYHFPARNRIISGLADNVIIVEGAYKSGSMITARLALDQGRNVFAVPGNINQPASTGVNSLIFDGAVPIINIEEVLETLGLDNRQMEIALVSADEKELKLLEIIGKNPGISCDEIALISGESAAKIMRTICSLELRGLVRIDGSRLYRS